jgi:ABC-2 type transport system ATP-binding protein
MAVVPAIEVRELSKRYGEFQATSGISFEVHAGELFGLLGPNGAGKTTTIKMLTGVLRPTSGSATIASFDCFGERVQVMQRVGYLPDEPIFYDYLKGSELIRFVADMHGIDRLLAKARSDALVERLDLGDAREEYAVNYSKGMKKKLALALALIHEPDVLILDEPTNGLDPYATRELLTIMREQSKAGKTVLFSTHLLAQAERLCHRVAIISHGRLAACGSVDELRTNAASSSLEDAFFVVTGGEPMPSEHEDRKDPPGA